MQAVRCIQYISPAPRYEELIKHKELRYSADNLLPASAILNKAEINAREKTASPIFFADR